MLKILQKTNSLAAVNGIKLFHTSQIQLVDQAWRRQRKLTLNPNTESPLTYLPDFSYMDGRPTPLGRNQKKRIIHQRELAGKIVEGIKEIDFAVERHAKLQQKEVKERENVMKNKLKPKGFRLLEKKK